MRFNWQFFYQNFYPTTSNARRMFAWQHKLLHKLHLGGFSFFCHFQPLCSVPPSASWMHCAVIPYRLVTVFCKNLETSFWRNVERNTKKGIIIVRNEPWASFERRIACPKIPRPRAPSVAVWIWAGIVLISRRLARFIKVIIWLPKSGKGQTF